MPTYLDITRPIHPDMAIYPHNPSVSFEQVQTATAGQSAVTRLELGTHTGTHIDAPSHIAAGVSGTATYPLEQLIGPAEMIDLSHVKDVISADDLPEVNASRVLLKTSNSHGDPNVFKDDFVALDESAAKKLVESNVTLVGIDGWSIKKKGVKDQTHAILLDAGVVILEGAWLADVPVGTYELLCLPLAIDLDGAPVRAVLTQG